MTTGQLVKSKTVIPPSTLSFHSSDKRESSIFVLLEHYDPPLGVCYPAIGDHTVDSSTKVRYTMNIHHHLGFIGPCIIVIVE